MKNLLEKLSKLFDTVLTVFSYIGIFLILGAFLIVSIDVIVRHFFNKSIYWVFEFTEYIMAVFAFLSAAWVLKKDGHVCLDFVLNMLPPRIQAIINIITSIFGFVISTLIAWFGAINVNFHFVKGTVTMDKAVIMPYWILMIFVPLGFFLLMIQFLRRAYKYYTIYKDKKEIESCSDITEQMESV